uniref:Acyl-coa synthetase n=1 Tax=Phlebotomus papatasi TaxID=29031 RepID=A0A1B0D5Z3_PHLPP
MFSTRYDSDQKIWSGRHLAPFHHESVSLGRAIYYNLSFNRNVVGQISAETGLTVTNGEICDQMLAIASNLAVRGAKKGQVIAIVAKNGPNIAPATFAAFFLGIAVNTLDPNYSVDEISHMLRQTQPCIVLCDRENYPNVQSAIQSMKSTARIINFGLRIEGVENIEDYLVPTGKEEALTREIVDVNGSTCAVILCSSGTTGMSKGVSLTHQHFLYMMSYPVFVDCYHNGIMLCFSSLYWLSGMAHLLLTTFLGMTRVITTETFNVDLCLDIIQKYQVTHLITAPVQLAGILSHKSLSPTSLASIREYMVGGSVVPKDNWLKIQAYMPNGSIKIVYGMSEVGYATCQEYRSTKYSTGKLAPDLQLKIVGDDGQNCPPGQTGEICFKPRFKFIGYIGNPEATNEIVDADGWVHSGDIGMMDADGDLQIVDRMKEILKYSNHHVSPSEIEEIIFSHPEVEYVAVVGVPDAVFTDLPAAMVVRKEGGTVTEKEISQLVASQLSNPKHLRGGVYFVNKLPLTPSGKVIKRKVKETVIELYKARHQ